MHRPSPFFPPTASVRCPSNPSPLPPASCPLPLAPTRYVPCHETLLRDLSTSPCSLPRASSFALHRCSFAISTSFLRIAIASGKHDKPSDFIRYRRLSLRFIFSGHSGIFARIHARYLGFAKEKEPRSLSQFRPPSVSLEASARLSIQASR